MGPWREVRRRVDVIVLIRLTPDVCERAAGLDPSILRSIDALHLAAALSFNDELEGLITYDDRLADAAILHSVEDVEPTA